MFFKEHVFSLNVVIQGDLIADEVVAYFAVPITSPMACFARLRERLAISFFGLPPLLRPELCWWTESLRHQLPHLFLVQQAHGFHHH